MMFPGILLVTVAAAVAAAGLFTIATAGRLYAKVTGLALLYASALVCLIGMKPILRLFTTGEAAAAAHAVPASYVLVAAAVMAAYLWFGLKTSGRLRRHYGTDEENALLERI